MRILYFQAYPVYGATEFLSDLGSQHVIVECFNNLGKLQKFSMIMALKSLLLL